MSGRCRSGGGDGEVVGPGRRVRPAAGVGTVGVSLWLAGYVGVSLVTARQYVQVANELVGLPLVATEFAKGRLSYSRVRALCRFVTPELEADMVEMARVATAAQLERMAAGVERAQRQNEPSDAADQLDLRGLRLTLEDDGTWSVRAG